jgi:hypothetical protein
MELSPLASRLAMAKVSITAVDLQAPGGGSVRVTGTWELNLTTPDDLADVLVTEDLVPDAVAEEGGVAITVLGAVRSTSETRITFSVETVGKLIQLSAPTMVHDGKILEGVHLDSSEDGKVLTYSFPTTPFGDEVGMAFGPFARAGEGAARSTTFDIGAVMTRNGLSGAFSERAGVEPVDILDGIPASVVEIDFARMTGSGGEGSNLLGVSVTGNWENVPDTKLILMDGSELRIRGLSSSYRRDSSGAIVAGVTRFTFPFTDVAALRGPATLAVVPPDVIVRGAWAVALHPER